MVTIAFVEDDPVFQAQLKSYMERFEKENNRMFRQLYYSDGLDITEGYQAAYDIIFLDIEMRHENGMQAAKKIRAMDQNVILVFITHLAKYALQGYKVEALSYLLKPVSYFSFSQELLRALKKIEDNTDTYWNIAQESKVARMKIRDIYYIEAEGHKITFHTADGPYTTRDSLKHLEEGLAGMNFCRCNHCFIVNLEHVKRISDFTLVLRDGTELAVSRPKRKQLLKQMSILIGGK